MEKGIIIKSDSFNITPYWVVKCDNPNLIGNRNGELPINPRTTPSEVALGEYGYYSRDITNMMVEFNVEKFGDDERLQWYATIKE